MDGQWSLFWKVLIWPSLAEFYQSSKFSSPKFILLHFNPHFLPRLWLSVDRPTTSQQVQISDAKYFPTGVTVAPLLFTSGVAIQSKKPSCWWTNRLLLLDQYFEDHSGSIHNSRHLKIFCNKSIIRILQHNVYLLVHLRTTLTSVMCCSARSGGQGLKI